MPGLFFYDMPQGLVCMVLDMEMFHVYKYGWLLY